MRGDVDDRAIRSRDWSGNFGGEWKPNPHFADALRELREDPARCERMAIATERELEGRRTLFDGTRGATP